MEKETRETHPSYGMVGISRATTGKGMNLFGSSIKHTSIIVLTVRKACKYRNLNNEWFYGENEIVELFLSPAQFAEMITTPNVGFGVPCTIRHIQGEDMGESPEFQQRQIFQKEFRESLKDLVDRARELETKVVDLFFDGKTVTKAQKLEIKSALRMIVQEIESNLPFVQEQFNEAMDKTVVEAKAEVEEFVNAKIHSLGIEKLSEMTDRLLSPVQSPVFELTAYEGDDA